MKSVGTVICELKNHGISIALFISPGGEPLLKVESETGEINPGFIESIRRFKPEILSALQKVQRCQEINRILDSNKVDYNTACQLLEEGGELFDQIPKELQSEVF